MSGQGVVIAGGGLAAQRCAETLRSRGYEAPIRIVCGEAEAPYDRPPLSKGVLRGELAADALRFRDPAWYGENAVELLLGRRAVGLRAAERRLVLDRGEHLAYEDLVIATGAAPRRLPALDRFSNALVLRSLDDVARLRAELGAGARLAIIGSGFIGQEVAATARGLGVEVTVIEALDLPLVGVLGTRVSRWLVDMHRDEGVRMLLASRLAGAAGNGRVERLALESGCAVDTDVVIVAVGVAPDTGWLAEAGLGPGGILTDPQGHTSVSHVFAAGDVAAPFDPRRGEYVRGEHWDAASRQGAAVARAILGDPPRPAPPASFWSDQYGVRIQYAGTTAGADGLRFDGDLDRRDFTVLYRRGGRPIAALAVGRPREFAALRRLLDQTPDPQPNQGDSDELPADNR